MMDITNQISTSLLQYGVLGVFTIILLYLAYILIKREQRKSDECTVENQRKDAEMWEQLKSYQIQMNQLRAEKDAEIQRLNTEVKQQTIPALLAATQAITASQTILQAIKYQQDVENAAITAKKEKLNAS